MLWKTYFVSLQLDFLSNTSRLVFGFKDWIRFAQFTILYRKAKLVLVRALSARAWGRREILNWVAPILIKLYCRKLRVQHHIVITLLWFHLWFQMIKGRRWHFTRFAFGAPSKYIYFIQFRSLRKLISGVVFVGVCALRCVGGIEAFDCWNFWGKSSRILPCCYLKKQFDKNFFDSVWPGMGAFHMNLRELFSSVGQISGPIWVAIQIE